MKGSERHDCTLRELVNKGISRRDFLDKGPRKSRMIGIGTLIIALTIIVSMTLTLGILLRLLRDADGT